MEKGEIMKRILIETERLKAIVELYLVCQNPQFVRETTDGKDPDMRVVIDEVGAHIMIPNMEGD